MRVTLRYFDGCPHWREAHERLGKALGVLGLEGQTVELERVESQEKAERLSFRGSPTILIEGKDPFASEDAPVGFSCRVYLTEVGYEGSPSVPQLREVLSPSA